MNGVGETHHDSERCLAAMVVARWCGTGWASVCEPNRATALVKCAQEAIKSGVFARPVVGSACDEAGYKPSIIRHPAHAGTAPCPPLHAQRTRIHTLAGKRVQSQSSTTGTTPSGPCCTKPSPSTSRLGMNLPVPGSICFPCNLSRFGFEYWRGDSPRRSLIPLGFQAASLPRIVGVPINGHERCKAGTPPTWV